MTRLIILTAGPKNWISKTLTKEAKKVGFEVEIIDPNGCFITLSDEPFISYHGEKFEGADIVIPRLSEDNLEYKMAVMNHLQKMDIKMLNTSKAMRTAANKVETQILLNDAGIRTPKTAVFTDVEQLDAALKSIGDKFPVIIKTLFGAQGIGVIRIDSKPSLISVVQQLLKTGTEFMIQEYFEHSESGRLLILDGKVLAAVMRTIPDGDFRSNAHQGAELKKHDPSEKEIEICLKSAEALGITFTAVDYIINDDDIILLEVNGSPGFEEMQKVIEDNIAQIVIKYCANQVGIEVDSDIEKYTEDDEKEEEKEEDSQNEPEKTEPEKTDEVDMTIKDDEVTLSNDVTDTENKIVGTITHVKIKHFNDDEPIEARVDTGATLSSIHGDNIEISDSTVKFKFKDTTYKFYLVKTTKIKQASSEESNERPVISVDMTIDDIELRNVLLTVTDRSHMNYDILLGRQTLASGGFLVNPAIGNISDSKQENKEEE